MTANTLGLLGIAFKAGRVEVGEEPVGNACRARTAKLVLLACDAAENSAHRAEKFAEQSKVPCVITPWGKAELGHALGRTSCAMVALTDEGLAAGLMKGLVAVDEERYGSCARQLQTAADALQRRKKEQSAARRKQRKPWAAPPKGTGKPNVKSSNGGGPI